MRRSAESRPLVPRPAEPPPPSDAELIAASRAADAAAYASLYERHVTAARNLARQLVHGRAEADDIVADAFAKVLDQLRRGRGPDGAFRPYLLTTVRRAAIDRLRAEGRLVITDEMEAFDPGVPFADPAVADLERTMIARAYASLPERWRAVLWHTEIEGARPAEVAGLLGLTANGVAALAYRAREGLRQAYLQMHLSGAVRNECRPVVAKLGPYVRSGLTKREAAAVAAHLEQCADCRAVYLELAEVNVALRGVVAPIILGPAAAAYLASVSHGGGVAAWFGGRVAWFRHAPKSQQAATAGVATAGMVGLVALALALTANTTPAPRVALPVPTHGVPAPAHNVPAPAHAIPAPTHGAPAAPPSPPPASHPAAPSPASPASRSAPPSATPAPALRRTSAPPPAPSPPPARLAALINPVGTMLPGGSGIIEFTVTNTGKRLSRPITAAITLPAGVRYVDPPIPGGWTCQTTTAGAACAHGPLQPGASTTGYLPVMVAAGAPAGRPPSIAVSGGGGPVVIASGQVGVAASGLGARFAATGPDTVVTTGAPFFRCRWENWEGWPPEHASAVPGWPGPSAAAALTLPGRVVWAGLYWAGSFWAGQPAPGSDIMLRGPGGDYQTVAASQVGYVTGTGGRSASEASEASEAFEAFADVTSLVAQHGAGVWSAAPPQPYDDASRWLWPWHRGGDFGWSLVVVTTDPGAASGTQVMVLDGAHVVGAYGSSLSVPLDGLPPGSQADVRTVTWTSAGPAMNSFTQNLAESPAVNFTGGNAPFLVGVVAVTDGP
jgi:RNA polymerase sigma factor (sigma-70 family)